MPPSRLGLHHNILNVNFYQSADEIVKNIIHGTLVHCNGILQSKGHNQVLEQANCAWHSERSLVHVFRGHEDLVATGITVHETHHLVASSGVDQCFCNRPRVFILRSCSVEISKIDADTPSAILLLHRHHTGDPLCTPARPDEPSIQHLLNFFLDFL